MDLIWTILVGFIVGFLAKFVIHGPSPSGFFMTAVLGIAGSLVATFAGRALNLYPPGQVASFLGSFVGAIVLLLIYHLIVKNRGSSS
ncbi:MAG: GlsB/YeaQ/YmgE family stress response membrane protein [Rhodanobacter sp.]|jgi:uncharacterized membrane protein YeaQ/YmgE (transglycosylase-associated protein family)|nr:GlsB/YeaQ/YmgE family stress response membrane protein [Rhodanobacter sp.]